MRPLRPSRVPGHGTAGPSPSPPASPPEPPLPGQRPRMRLRTGAGAAVVLVAAALVGAVLVQAVQSASAEGPAASDTRGPGAADDGAPGTDAGSGATGVPDRTAPTAGGAGADGSASGAAEGSDAGADGAAGVAAGTGSPPPIYVHVVGAVATPGLFPLPAGSRVVDAIAAAHGFAEGADTAGVNLARVLADGEQLVVPKQGEAPAGAAGGPAPPGATGAGPAAPVDLNTATAEQLETLPRVGPAMAARIIAWRSAHGRFAHVADLGRVPGIGDRTLASLTPLVRV